MFPKRKLYFEKIKKSECVSDDFTFEVRDENESIMIVVNVFESSGDKILPKIEAVYIYNTSSKDAKTDWIQVEKSLMNEHVLNALADRFIDENILDIQDMFRDWMEKNASNI